jgi:uncharacterized protein
MGNAVVHFEICVKDDKAANKFYGDLFGWKINADNPANYGMVDTDSAGVGIGGGISKPPEGVDPYTTVYVNVDDVQAKLDEAEKLGAKTLMPADAGAGRSRDRDLRGPGREHDRSRQDVGQPLGAGASRST